MPKLVPSALFLLLVAAAGCIEREAPPGDIEATMSGTVDPDLPPDLAANQALLKLILDSMIGLRQVGCLFEEGYSPRFEESREEFFERGAVRLHGWRFDGPPYDNEVPVVLYLDMDATGRHQLEVRRVYAVVDIDGVVTFRRR